MLKSSLCDYRDAYILVSRTTSIGNTTAQSADANNNTKNCVPFTDCISKLNNT